MVVCYLVITKRHVTECSRGGKQHTLEDGNDTKIRGIFDGLSTSGLLVKYFLKSPHKSALEKQSMVKFEQNVITTVYY